MKKYSLLFFIAFMITSLANSQNSKIVGLNFNSFGAVHNFKDNITKNPVGVSFSFLWAPQNSKFQYGLEYGIAMYSSNEYEYELINEGRPGEFVDVYEEDCFMKYHLVGRYLPYTSPLATTYIEARAGFSSFFSSTTAEEESEYFEDEFDFHGTAFNTALGGGIMINLSHVFNKGNISYTPVFLDFGATYNSGSRAEYRNMNEGEVVRDLDHGKFKSKTNTMNYKVGVAVKF